VQSTEAQINEDFILLFFSKAAEDFFKASVPFASAFFLLFGLVAFASVYGFFWLCGCHVRNTTQCM